MSQFQGSFKRYELKYLIDEKNYIVLRQKLKDKLIPDNFGKSTICNIYFDTPDHQLVRTSLEKPIYKEKLRLRSYGTPSEGDTVFLELKKKYQGIVYKRREKLELSTAEHYLYASEPINQHSQILNEIDWFISFYKELIPSMYISYNRIALHDIDDPELRITFDSNILWREEELWLECGVWGNPMLEQGWRLLEIKMPGVMPLWLSRILAESEIYPSSFSKYGRGYEQLVQKMKNKNHKGDIIYA